MIGDCTYAKPLREESERLHIHPDDLNGLVSLERMVRIVESIKTWKSKAGSLRWVKIYAICEGLVDEE